VCPVFARFAHFAPWYSHSQPIFIFFFFFPLPVTHTRFILPDSQYGPAVKNPLTLSRQVIDKIMVWTLSVNVDGALRTVFVNRYTPSPLVPPGPDSAWVDVKSMPSPFINSMIGAFLMILVIALVSLSNLCSV
jgi:hypothetical protein